MSGLVGYGPVLDAGRNDKHIAGLHHQRLGILHFDAKLAIPAKEQLVLLVAMPGELTFESGKANHCVVDHCEIERLPRSSKSGNGRCDRY